jgi:signal transduction histidine kinase
MRLPSKPSLSKEFEPGRMDGQETERTLMARKLHQICECLTAASFAIELAKKPGEQQTELLSRASNLLAEATALVRQGQEGRKDENLRRQSPPENPPGGP